MAARKRRASSSRRAPRRGPVAKVTRDIRRVVNRVTRPLRRL